MCSNPDQLSQHLSLIKHRAGFCSCRYAKTIVEPQLPLSEREGCEILQASVCMCVCVCVCVYVCTCARVFLIFVSLFSPPNGPAPQTVSAARTRLFLWKSGWIQFTLPQDMIPLLLLLLPCCPPPLSILLNNSPPFLLLLFIPFSFFYFCPCWTSLFPYLGYPFFLCLLSFSFFSLFCFSFFCFLSFLSPWSIA